MMGDNVSSDEELAVFDNIKAALGRNNGKPLVCQPG